MKYAVIKSGSKQYRVSEGDLIEVDLIKGQPQDAYTFSDVLLFVDEATRKIGNPLLSDVSVKGIIVENKKGKKIRVAKFKAKARYRRVMGFRPSLTAVKIENISLKNASASTEQKSKTQSKKEQSKDTE